MDGASHARRRIKRASVVRPPAQILIRWNLQLGTVPLPKANRVPHLEENIDVFDFEIRDPDMSALNGLNEEYSALGSLAYA
jgi:2,5-diketo-D-gluconate reductase A